MLIAVWTRSGRPEARRPLPNKQAVAASLAIRSFWCACHTIWVGISSTMPGNAGGLATPPSPALPRSIASGRQDLGAGKVGAGNPGDVGGGIAQQRHGCRVGQFRLSFHDAVQQVAVFLDRPRAMRSANGNAKHLPEGEAEQLAD